MAKPLRRKILFKPLAEYRYGSAARRRPLTKNSARSLMHPPTRQSGSEGGCGPRSRPSRHRPIVTAFGLVDHLAFPLARIVAGHNVPLDHSIPENGQGVQHIDSALVASVEGMPCEAHGPVGRQQSYYLDEVAGVRRFSGQRGNLLGQPINSIGVLSKSRRMGRSRFFGPCPYTAASACSKSAMMSSLSSMPIESRTVSGPAPAVTFCASVSCRCVVEAGWMMSERVSPILAR
jgi:hypothetical protein